MKKFDLLLVFLLTLLPFSTSAQQNQSLTIAGIVLSDEDEPLPGVSVYIENKPSVGTVTDNNGKFSIKVAYGDRLIFRFIGFDNGEHVAVKNESNLVVKLGKSGSALDEVIVAALGERRKISNVAAITSVNVQDLQTPAPSITNLLGGRAPGVITMQTSGEPGKNLAEFWVRGIGTFGANAGALVLIDGLEGDLNSIDPSDIESFSILKDASATAVYGVRGANGVVLVTTKKGTIDKLQLTFRANTTLNHLTRIPNYVGATDYAKLANEASVVRGGLPIYNEVEMGIIERGLDQDIFPNVSWQDEVLRQTSWRQSYYVSGRGGSELARYFMSLGMSNDNAAYNVDKGSIYSSNVGYNTYNYRLNLDLSLSSSTTVYLGTDGFLSVVKQPGMANTDFIWEAQSQITPLTFPKQYSNGLYPAYGGGNQSSPYVMINRTGTANNQEFRGKTTLALKQDLSSILKGLKFRIQGAYDIQSFMTERRYVQPPLFQAIGRNQNGELIMSERVQAQNARYSKTNNQFRKYHLEMTVNYDHLFSGGHRVSGLVYYYIDDRQNSKDATASLTAIPLRYQGVSSRLTYDYMDTYMIDVNFGYTGSENFQPGHQYGFFPSIAMGWVPTGYKYVKEHMPWLDYFKIRASYGTVGNDRITSRRFPYLTKANRGSGRIFSGPVVEMINETTIGADNLRWEKAIKSDLGIEANLFNEKIEFVIDFFNDQRNGIFQQRVQVPDYAGLISLPFGNVGKMKSFGSDGNISYKAELTDKIGVTLRANYTYSNNKVQNWEEAYLEYPYLEKNGFPLNSIRGYQAIGLFKDEDDIKYSPTQTFGTVLPGDIKYKDVNGDGVIDALDKVPLAESTYPLLMYGFAGEFRYKNFTLGVFFRGTGKTPFYYVGQSGNGMGYVPFFGQDLGNVISLANDPRNRWIPLDYAVSHGMDPALAENPNARFPRLQYGKNNNNSQLSSFWQGDARYLRLQEVTLNYHLGRVDLEIFKRKFGFTAIDLQLIGNNLYVWDKVKLFDPEQARYNGRKYPIPTTYSFQVFLHF